MAEVMTIAAGVLVLVGVLLKLNKVATPDVEYAARQQQRRRDRRRRRRARRRTWPPAVTCTDEESFAESMSALGRTVDGGRR